jgi:hypothetical protein
MGHIQRYLAQNYFRHVQSYISPSIKTLPASYFKDIKLPPPAQQPADALPPPPPPPPALQPVIPAGEAIVPGPVEPAQEGPAAADAEAAPAAPLPDPPSQQARRPGRLITFGMPQRPAQGTTGIPAVRSKRIKQTTRRGNDDDE